MSPGFLISLGRLFCCFVEDQAYHYSIICRLYDIGGAGSVHTGERGLWVQQGAQNTTLGGSTAESNCLKESVLCVCVLYCIKCWYSCLIEFQWLVYYGGWPFHLQCIFQSVCLRSLPSHSPVRHQFNSSIEDCDWRTLDSLSLMNCDFPSLSFFLSAPPPSRPQPLFSDKCLMKAASIYLCAEQHNLHITGNVTQSLPSLPKHLHRLRLRML